MAALTEFLFPAPARRSTGAILGWWERRRLPYNLMVGGAGVVSLALAQLVSWLPPDARRLPFIDWRPVVVFAVLANLCYLLGPATEIALEKLWRGSLLPTGPGLYRMGLTFSVGLALLPTLIVLLDWIVRIVSALA